MADKTQCDLLCGICKSPYTSPRTLDCFHIFCSPCLEQLIKDKSTFSCPLCRAVFAVPKSGIKDFDVFPFHGVTKEKSEDENKICCQMCDENEVYSYCKDCKQTMCRSCHDYHSKHKILRGHKVEKYVKSGEHCMEREVKRCDKHKKEYSLYCKPCNRPVCEQCMKTLHQSHKTLPIETAASVMRHSLSVAVNGLKSKMPFIDNFLENLKAEEMKYFSHERQTRNEMKLAATNLKDTLCKSVDMILVRNMTILETKTCEDKKRIQIYNEEAEREKFSILNLIKNSDDTLTFADDYEVTTLASAMCRKISLFEKSCFQSELKISSPKFICGSFSNKPVEDFMGKVERTEKNTLDFKLKLPCHEISQWPCLNKMEKILDLSRKSNIRCISADCDQNIFLFKINSKWQQGQMEVIYACTIICMNLDGQICWEKTGKELVNICNKPSIIGVRSRKVFVMFSNTISCVDFNVCPTLTTSQLEIDIPKSSNCVACFLRNDNILILHHDTKTLYEVDQKGVIVRNISNSDISKLNNVCGILYTLSNHILISCGTKILSFDLSGDLVYTFDHPSSDFRSICSDRHDNVFAADYENCRICLLTSDGYYVRDVLSREDGIYNPLSMTIDSLGNLWVLMDGRIKVFAYL